LISRGGEDALGQQVFMFQPGTTPRVRAELPKSQGTSRRLAACYGLNPKTAAKGWRWRTSTADAPMEPSRSRRLDLTEAEDAIAAAFRCRRTLLSLDERSVRRSG